MSNNNRNSKGKGNLYTSNNFEILNVNKIGVKNNKIYKTANNTPDFNNKIKKILIRNINENDKNNILMKLTN